MDISKAYKYCTQCGKTLGPHAQECCQTGSLVAITGSRVGPETRYFDMRGKEISEEELRVISSHEAEIVRTTEPREVELNHHEHKHESELRPVGIAVRYSIFVLFLLFLNGVILSAPLNFGLVLIICLFVGSLFALIILFSQKGISFSTKLKQLAVVFLVALAQIGIAALVTLKISY